MHELAKYPGMYYDLGISWWLENFSYSFYTILPDTQTPWKYPRKKYMQFRGQFVTLQW